MRIGVSHIFENKTPIFNHKNFASRRRWGLIFFPQKIQASKDLVDASMAVFALFFHGRKTEGFLQMLGEVY